MCKLAGINFGYADAEKELLETPELFDSAFVDPRNYLSKLLDGIPFLVLGRKGAGKTAYGAKIRRLAQDNPDMIAQSCSLSDLNYSIFESFADQTVNGGRRFLNVWKYLLLIEMIKLIETTCTEQENNLFTSFVSALKEEGILPSESLVHRAKHLRTTGVSLNIGKILEATTSTQCELVLSGIDEIAEHGLSVLSDIYLGDKRFYIIIDGLDDALRGKNFSSDIITGLIRAADVINSTFRYSTLKFKIIILLRSDIYHLCRDPDLNKIKHDLSVNLSWTKEALQEIVIKRIQEKYPQYGTFHSFWDTYAPKSYKNKKSSSILTELTLLRPRDMLQFFRECQELYGNNTCLTFSEFSATISAYSKDYFIDEMKDELTGILPDKTITAIPSIFSELGKREFFVQDIEPLATTYDIDVSGHQLLETLFSLGYVGQVRQRENNGKTFHAISFVHVNPYDKFSASDKCILHRGLVKAVNIN